MTRICLVYDTLGDPKRRWAFPLIDILVDPVIAHLPGAEKVDQAQPDAVNVRFWTNCESGVFMGHGIADKLTRNAEHLRQFDVICHSGPRWERKYLSEGVPAHKLRQVGYTKIDTLLALKQQRHAVLWAPTWSALWEQPYHELAAMLRKLGDVEISEHCLDRPYGVTLQPLVDADVVIADGGSTVYEAWALDKPVVFPDWAVAGTGVIVRGSIEHEIYERQIGYHVTDPRQLLPTIERAREHGITSAERDFIDDILPPELRGTSGKAHADALLADGMAHAA